jgi:hypothetical protein
MKRLIFFLLIILACSHCFPQKHLKTFNNCQSGKLFSARNGDTVLIQCDTVLLLYRKFAGKYKDIINGYQSYVALLNMRIDEQAGEYNKLRILYDTMMFRSADYIRRTNSSLIVLKDSVQKSILYIHSAQKGMDEIRSEVKKGMQKNNLARNIVWGTSGLAAGILAGVLIGLFH